MALPGLTSLPPLHGRLVRVHPPLRRWVPLPGSDHGPGGAPPGPPAWARGGGHEKPPPGAPGLRRAGGGPERSAPPRVGPEAAHPAGEAGPAQAAAAGGVAGAEGSTFRFRPAPRTTASTPNTTAPVSNPPSWIWSVCDTVLMASGSQAH